MWGLAYRIIKHPLDYIGLFKRHEITFERRIDENNSIDTFIFRSNQPISWKAGQHALFFPQIKITGKQYRVFSIASASTEGVIQISTNIPPEPSSFKQHLLSLQPGDKMTMSGPVGELYERASITKIVGVAGGVGITPFRSILAEHSKSAQPNCEIHLIHAGKNGHHLYRSEIEKFAEDPTISIQFVESSTEVNIALDEHIKKFQNDAYYYISGSPGMIGALTQRLKEANITKIVNDPFKGY